MSGPALGESQGFRVYGGDSFSLQEILGHSTLEMTRRYVHLASRDMAEQHKKFSPICFLNQLGREKISQQLA
ncbi:MAG: hypothetical protein WCU88_10405 [Elusimicrobiota bacterium]|jgi:integrase